MRVGRQNRGASASLISKQLGVLKPGVLVRGGREERSVHYA